MKEREKMRKRRWRGLLAIAMCLALVSGWFQLPGVVYATEEVFPESISTYTESGDTYTSGETVDSGSVSETPSTSEEPSGSEEESSGSEEEDSGSEEEGSGSEEEPSGSEEEGSGSEEEPSEEEKDDDTNTQPVVKKAGQVTVRMDDFVYGGTAPAVWVGSLTGDASKAVITFKVTGAADSTYTSSVPTAVGNYTVRAVLPEDSKYTVATATDTFTISYLKAPTPAFNMNGTRGEEGWYISDVTITPPAGYELSVGNRNQFSAEAYRVTESTEGLRLFLRRIDTGEMTDVISIAHLRIDKTDPELKDVVNGEAYYGDEISFTAVDESLKTVTVDGKAVELTQDEEGNSVFTVKVEDEKREYEIVLTDTAGNQAVYKIELGPDWMKEGTIGVGKYYLAPGVKYYLMEGCNWKAEGDSTIYTGGTYFYVDSEGWYNFSRY